MDWSITGRKSREFGARVDPLFDRALARWILLLGLPLLFLPKWNLVMIQTETAGLRIDDLVLLLIGGMTVSAHLWAHPPIQPLEKAVFWFTLLSLLSFFSNKILVQAGEMVLEAKIFYVFRLAEYFLFFYIGRLAAIYIDTRQLFLALFGWNAIWMLLQKASWVGGLSITGYTDVSARVQGIASFPSEMGLWLNLFFCWFFFEEGEPSTKKPKLGFAKFLDEDAKRGNIQGNGLLRNDLFYSSEETHLAGGSTSENLRPRTLQSRAKMLLCLFLVCTLLTVWTGNRISIMALFIAAGWGFFRDFRRHPPIVRWGGLLLLPVVLVLGWVLMIETESVAFRSKDLFSWKNLSLVEYVWNDMVEDPLQPENISMEELDASWWLRIHKWVYILKIYLSQPLCYCQGIGPGVAWSALDGGWLRVWTETGLTGLFVFGWMIRLLMKIHLKMRWMVFVWLLNSIFFDAYLAYKAMSLLFFSAGCLDHWKQQQIDAFKVGESEKI